MELVSISGQEREKERQYPIYVGVTVNVQKYLCIDLQLTIWIKSDAPENGSVQWRNPLIQDSMLHDALDQLWFLKGYFDLVHSIEQKSIALRFLKSRTGSHVTYCCHHNLSRFTFPIFLHSWSFSVFHTLQSTTPRIY